MTPQEIAAHVRESWGRHHEADRRPGQARPSVYASGWRVCDRRLVYDATIPDQAPPWTGEQLARFRRGEDRERDLLADMTKVGRNAEPPFKITNQQERFELKGRRGQVVIAGKV